MSALQTNEGKSKVRGYMHMQELILMTKSGKHKPDPIYENVSDESISMFKNYIDIGAIILSATFRHSGQVYYTYGNIYSSALFIRDHPDSYFHLVVQGEDGAHSLAMVHTDSAYGFFDPNYGVAIMPKQGQGSTRRFCTSVDEFIQNSYYGGLSNTHAMNAFESKLCPKATIRI